MEYYLHAQKDFSKRPPLEPATTSMQVGIFSFSSKYPKYIDIFQRRGQIIFNPNLFRREMSIYVFRSAPTKNRYSTPYLPTPVLSPEKSSGSPPQYKPIIFAFKILFHVLLPFYFLT